MPPEDDVHHRRAAYAIDMNRESDVTALDFVWSKWVPLASAGIASGAMTAALHQREHGAASAGWLWLYGALALSPFVLDAIATLFRVPVSPPLWLFPVPVLVGGGLLVAHPAVMDFTPFIFVFLAAEVASRARGLSVVSIGTTLAANGLMVGLDAAGRFDSSFIWVIGITFGWFGGFMVNTFAQMAAELKQAQADVERKAVTDERQRIAREIHDVIAHSMSVTMLHITAARMALERRRDADALDALREAEQQGRNSLNDIRRTVGLLGPDEEANATPMPTAADLPRLISDFRTAGLDVAFDLVGDLGALPSAPGLNLYRIVQESLTNVTKHAPGAKATVALDVGGDKIRLLVRNESSNGASGATGDGNGLGLRGMAGRAAMLSGTLDARADRDGWVVSLVAPRPSA